MRHPEDVDEHLGGISESRWAVGIEANPGESISSGTTREEFPAGIGGDGKDFVVYRLTGGLHSVKGCDDGCGAADLV